MRSQAKETRKAHKSAVSWDFMDVKKACELYTARGLCKMTKAGSAAGVHAWGSVGEPPDGGISSPSNSKNKKPL